MCANCCPHVMPWLKEVTFLTDSFTRNGFHWSKFYGGKSSTGDLRHKHVVAILRNVRKELVVSSGASWDDEDIFHGGEVGHGVDCTLHSVLGKVINFFGHRSIWHKNQFLNAYLWALLSSFQKHLVFGDVGNVADVITSGLKDCICIFPLFQNLRQKELLLFGKLCFWPLAWIVGSFLTGELPHVQKSAKLLLDQPCIQGLYIHHYYAAVLLDRLLLHHLLNNLLCRPQLSSSKAVKYWVLERCLIFLWTIESVKLLGVKKPRFGVND